MDDHRLKNQPYDEIHEVEESEIQTPRIQRSAENRTRMKGQGLMSVNSDSDDFDDDHKRVNEPIRRQLGISPHEEDEEEDESDEEEESDDEEESSRAPEGAYDASDYAHLPVSTEIKELFQYITRYSPQSIELDHSLMPFIPDFIPAVGDIDAFLKVQRPDGKGDSLGLLVLDEPSVKQSDPTVMSLWLSEESKQHRAAEVKVTSVSSPQTKPRQVDSWVESISALHRSRPPASVQYGRAMPDIDSLMQEWPVDVEELLGRIQLPSAHLDCSPAQYTDIICSLLDIPVSSNRIQSLHLLFSLYLQFRDSQHFTNRVTLHT